MLARGIYIWRIGIIYKKLRSKVEGGIMEVLC